MRSDAAEEKVQNRTTLCGIATPRLRAFARVVLVVRGQSSLDVIRQDQAGDFEMVA